MMVDRNGAIGVALTTCCATKKLPLAPAHPIMLLAAFWVHKTSAHRHQLTEKELEYPFQEPIPITAGELWFRMLRE